MTTPAVTHYLGFCAICRAIKQFTTEREHDLWLAYHPHEREDYTDD